MLSTTYRSTACPEAQSTKAAGLLRAARPATRHVPFSSATSNSQGSSSRPNEYFGSDGRRKSTIEEALSPDTKGSLNTAVSGGRQPPWGISWQTNEQSLEWNDDIKQRLLTVCCGMGSKADSLSSLCKLLSDSTLVFGTACDCSKAKHHRRSHVTKTGRAATPVAKSSPENGCHGP